MNNAQCGCADISFSEEEWDTIFAEGSTSLDTPPSPESLSRQSSVGSEATGRGDPAQVILDGTNSASPERTSGSVSQGEGKAREGLGATIPAQDITPQPDFDSVLFSMALEKADREYAEFLGTGINSFGIEGSGEVGFYDTSNVQEPSFIKDDELQAMPGYDWQIDDELTQLLQAAIGDSKSEEAGLGECDTVIGPEEIHIPQPTQDAELDGTEDCDFKDAALTLITEPSSSVDDIYVFSQDDPTLGAYPMRRTPSFSSLFGNYPDDPEEASIPASPQTEIPERSPAPSGEAIPINSPNHPSGMEIDSCTEYDEDASEDEYMGVDDSDLEIDEDEMDEDEKTELDANGDEAEDESSKDADTERCTREGYEEGGAYDDSSDSSDEDMDDSERLPGDMTPKNTTYKPIAVKSPSPVPETPRPINAYVSPPTPARVDNETPLYQRNSVYWEGQANAEHTIYPQPWEVEVNEEAGTLVYDGQIYQLMDFSS